MADAEKHAAIRELRGRYQENALKIVQLDAQKRQAEMALKRAAFTAAQLDEMPEGVRTYESVGKAYFLQPKAAMMSRMEERVSGADAELRRLAASREALASSQESLGREVTELVGGLRGPGA